jgi:hypothetical protein
MNTKHFTRRELEEHYDNDRFHTIEIYNINEECVTYSAIMDTDDGKHYAVQYYVPHKLGKIRFHTGNYPEVYSTPVLDLRMGYSVEGNKVETNITPENLTSEQKSAYIQVLENALKNFRIKAVPSDRGVSEREEK